MIRLGEGLLFFADEEVDDAAEYFEQSRRLTKPRVRGGPNVDFLKRYSLDETSHPMDWFLALMLMTPTMNQEDPAAANVKGDKTTVFAVSNWTAYSNTKTIMCNAGEPGSIYAGRFKPFKNKDISAMLAVYIIDGLAPSPQLTWKMQDQEHQPTQGNDRIAGPSLGLVGSRSTGHSSISLQPKNT